MAGLGPATHAFLFAEPEAWMAAPSAAMTKRGRSRRF